MDVPGCPQVPQAAPPAGEADDLGSSVEKLTADATVEVTGVL